MLQRRRLPGFTLIELMIAVAIVSVLAAVAFPSYQSYIRKGKRTAAQAALMDLASKQQTYLLDRRSYLAANAEASLSALQWSKPKEIENDYTFTCPDADCTTTAFKVYATPSSALQAKGEQTMTVDQTGTKTPVATGYWGK